MKKILYTLLFSAAGMMSTNLLAQSPPLQNTPLMKPAPVAVYEAFGEKPGLVKLMDDFMVRLVANPLTGPVFGPANQVRIKAELVEQFCQLLSGPCTYQGLSMKAAHASLHINKPQFNALVEELQKSMDAMNIPFRDQNQLLAQLAPMYRDVITVK
ncbi:group 1 truncated hemoglobin [Glaciimonas sp. CA11.2]|uniref:group I truncated hemoglobin n=1 Tax=unclassified Glaciimonas TaxID=2644401 RepID=UPI002AB44C49|nr:MULTISPECIES: group 1 truncated hemoglobin [unclassified Glaciimonas]MDY7546994.1 group 1 truncated hemoglobin [Glaciimonas sp. CA11.2]MEB0011159.1 group 1 truncated hemoglobin [Glaciimonas sp. Cout2]MEB0081164.1 group 1 truncated hemoglobin [Glaciimonas sp. Gout2]MEB0164486.1 group 1 truncated hemoglobin [Glaciimonas sp. CA11.2]